MAVMMGSLYAALRDAGVPEDRAQRAAEEMAAVNDVTDIKADVSKLKTDLAAVGTDVTTVKADVGVMKWMLGFELAILAAVAGRLFVVPHRDGSWPPVWP